MNPEESPPLDDTAPEVRDLWIALMRERGLPWRVRRTLELTTLFWNASRLAVEQAHPDATPAERDWIFVNARYGRELADGVVAARRERGDYDDDP